MSSKLRRSRDDVDKANILPERMRPVGDQPWTEKQKANGVNTHRICFHLTNWSFSPDENGKQREINQLQKGLKKVKKAARPIPSTCCYSISSLGCAVTISQSSIHG